VIERTKAPNRAPAEMPVSQAFLARVQAAIEDLPVEQRLALALRKGAGMPYWHIADVLQCDEALARQATYFAIRALRSRLGNDLSATHPGPAGTTGRGHHVSSMKGDTP
jgi:DNA-directed RNA polymerase specialized sigma24 family protein